MNSKKKRLGRGLDAFFDGEDGLKSIRESDEIIKNVGVEKIEPNPYQPRESFREEGLEELAASIKENGVLQPLILTPKGEEGYYIVAGERRWRASKMANKDTVPAIIKEFEEDRMMEIALVENIHRDDLNPLEEATAYKQLLERMEMTQGELAERLGKSRSGISNSLRLLKLPVKIQEYVSRGTLSAGQARALAGLEDPELQLKGAEEIIDQEMSVRQAEKHVSAIKERISGDETSGEDADGMLNELEELLDRTGRQLGDEQGDELDGIANQAESLEWKRHSRELEEITGLTVKLEERGDGFKAELVCSNLEELRNLLKLLK